MKYTVRNEHGQLTFDSLTQLRVMYQQGLVTSEDQVQVEGTAAWRSIEALPELQGVGPPKAAGSNWGWWGAGVASLLAAALFALRALHSPLVAAALMVPVLALSQRAFVQAVKRRRQ